MPLKIEATEEPALNLTPMIDVVFLLIIFFMVGTQFAEQEREFDVELPSVSAAPPLTGRPDPITVNVLANGDIRIDRQAVNPASLATLLRQAIENYPDQAVVIRGDADVRYQHVAEAMAACRQAGVRIVSQAVRMEQDEDSP